MKQHTDSQTTEEKILKAAEREFITKGYAGARTTAIAAAAGVTHAMLHYYFRTKENLFQQIIQQKIKKLKGMMFGTVVDINLPFEEKIAYLVRNHMDFLAENPDMPPFIISVITSSPEWHEFLKENITKTGAEVIGALQKELDRNAELGVCKKTDAKMLILDILSLNIFSFIGAPLVKFILGDITNPDFIEQRKQNNVEMILNKLKP